MKNSIINIILLILLLSVVGLIVYKVTQREDNIPDFLLSSPHIGSIQIEKRINGKIAPEEEIHVKSTINGLVENIYVEVGQKVRMGDKIAEIKNLSEPMDIENLRSMVKISQIQYEAAELVFKREKMLYDEGINPKADYENMLSQFEQSRERLRSAENRLAMATTGILSDEKDLSNIVYAPASGVIMSLNVKKGSPVIRQNNYNEGSTITTIADMDQMVFFGEILERDIEVLYTGMPIELELTANPQMRLKGSISKIHPKGFDSNGIVKFPIEALVEYEGNKKWSGLSAIAIIVLEKKDSVLLIEEKYLIYENDSCFVMKRGEKNTIFKNPVGIGISDGIKTEVVSGLEINDNIKLPSISL